MSVPNPEPLLGFFGGWLKRDPLIAFILALGLLCGVQTYIIINQSNRIDNLQEDKIKIISNLLGEQIKTDKKMDVIQEALERTTEELRSLRQKNEDRRR